MKLDSDLSLKIVYIYDMIVVILLAGFGVYFLISPLIGVPFLILAAVFFKIALWIKKRNRYGFYGNLIWIFISLVSGIQTSITENYMNVIGVFLSLFILYLLLKKDVRSIFLKK